MAASSLKRIKENGTDEDDDKDESSSANEKTPIDVELGPVKLDRPRQFVIPNGCRQGYVVFHALFCQTGSVTDYRACAERKSDTSKYPRS